MCAGCSRIRKASQSEFVECPGLVMVMVLSWVGASVNFEFGCEALVMAMVGQGGFGISSEL